MVIAFANGEILENYPEDQRGHSYLVLGYTRDGKALHAVCGFDPSGTLVIITELEPSTATAPPLVFPKRGQSLVTSKVCLYRFSKFKL